MSTGIIKYLADANHILIDFDGHKAYLQDKSLWAYDTSDVLPLSATLLTNKSDLGQPSFDKIVNYYDMDYKGSGYIYFFIDGNLSSTAILDFNTSRVTKRFYISLDNRKPALKVQWQFLTSDPTTRIYGMEVDFDLLEKRIMVDESIKGK